MIIRELDVNCHLAFDISVSKTQEILEKVQFYT